jgi:tetratricopeptide (TPR) repeat protein
MNKQRWNTVHRVLGDCLALPPAQRAAYAAKRCGEDEELLGEVMSLLRASTEADGYFESLVVRTDEMARGDDAGMIGRDVGHFHITARLGGGGMGQVYRACDTRLHREVALKVLSNGGDEDPKVSARFDREATVLAALNHPNIAAIYGREELDDRPVLVLELVDGVTLKDRLGDGPLHVEEALHVALGIARGLEAAHEKGIVHRDLKPSNVMLTRRGEVKVLDFGIAKPLALSEAMAGGGDLTATGVLLGTVPYMSPEQVRGNKIDPRTDVWAFGCILYEMLSGQKAFERETVADTLAAIIEHQPRCEILPDSTPARLEELICHAIDKRVEERLDSIVEARRALEKLLVDRTDGTVVLTMASADSLELARRYTAEHAWQRAFDILDPAFCALDADDLARLGEAAWWVGRLDRCVEADQKAYAMYIAADERTKAAHMAIRLADHCGRRLLPAMVNGWLGRAGRLLEGQPLSPVHAWLLRATIQQALGEGDYDEAGRQADQMLRHAEELADTDLQAVAIHYQGLALVKSGKTREGMQLIDEAAVAAISGELSPMATSIIYCNAVSACRSLADYRRAGEWTEAARRWCERQAISGFPGICRVTRAEVMRLHGNWIDAEREALRACDELESFAPAVARVAFHELGEIRLRMGEYALSRAAFDSARQLGRDPQPGAALLELAEGDADAAAASIRRALEGETSDLLARSRLLPAQVEIALSRDDFDTARRACAELEEIAARFDAAVVRAAAAHACGALALAEDELDVAAARLRDAVRHWEEAMVPYEAARARELQARVYELDGDEVSAQLEMRAACETFVQLGAAHDSRRVAEHLADTWV